ncbi:MAG: hypothetical protein KIT33_11925 [Candidatus Kapabacteria bacterium]|nr:hypothetical protein [Ignavibacteriota bacterium]MCW5885668.1 hypothetical protein [Candidatus Kapabacteria bacterium]
MINSIGNYYPDISVTRVRSTYGFTDVDENKIANTKFTDKLSEDKFTKSNNSADELSSEEKKLVERLKRIEQQVIAHEQAHIAAGGGLVRGGASYSYQSGPDGKRYIVGGEVQIDASPLPDDPEGTISKMQQVRRAALAPSDPSPQDRAVANEASKNEMSARMELSRMQMEKFNSNLNITPEFVNAYA